MTGTAGSCVANRGRRPLSIPFLPGLRDHGFVRLAIFSLIVVAGLAAASLAQTGEPIIQEPGSGNTGPSPIFIDAYQYRSKGDMCTAIQWAMAAIASVNNGVVDARGFTGPQSCLENMFLVQGTTQTYPTWGRWPTQAVLWLEWGAERRVAHSLYRLD